MFNAPTSSLTFPPVPPSGLATNINLGTAKIGLKWSNTSTIPPAIIHIDMSSDGGSTWTVDQAVLLTAATVWDSPNGYLGIQNSVWRMRYNLFGTYSSYTSTVSWQVPDVPDNVLWDFVPPGIYGLHFENNNNSYTVNYSVTFNPSGEIKTGSINSGDHSIEFPSSPTDTGGCVHFYVDEPSPDVCVP